MRRKLCYVISDVDSSHLVESNVRSIDPARFDLCTVFLAKQPPKIYETLKKEGFHVKYIPGSGKRALLPTMFRLYRLFGRLRPDIVHTHLFNAAVTGLTAAWARGIPRRINTRHHSSELHRYHPHAVYYDHYINWLSTDIVAISETVRKVLVEKESVNPNKVAVVYHGFDFDRFENTYQNKTDLKEKYGMTESWPIIGVISRHVHWKGIQYTIPAFQSLLVKYPRAKLVLANAVGNHKDALMALLEPIDPKNYEVIEFETDVFSLYRSFDVFVHVPIGPEYEAFGQVYIEALFLGVPSVFTLSGVALDLVNDGENAIVVPYRDSSAIEVAIERILSEPGLREKLVLNGRNSVLYSFSAERMVRELTEIYGRK